MTFKNLGKAIEQAVQEGADQTVAQQGGGGADPPAAGPCLLRLVSYIELGKHASNYQGKPKTEDQVAVTFELSGKKHPPIETENGVFPHLITATLNLSLNDKAKFFKLFSIVNYQGKAKHMAELAMQNAPARGMVVHREYVGKDGKKRIAADLYDRELGAWKIAPPRVDVLDEDGQPTGEQRDIKVAPALSPTRIFLWNQADMEQWASLFIEGEYPERKDDKGVVTAPAKSKNQFQLKIASALNYKGSPIQKLLANGGEELDLSGLGADDDGEGEAAEAPANATAKPAVASKPAAPAKAPKTATKPKRDPLDLDDDIPF